MNQNNQLTGIAESLRKILSELDHMEEPLAAIKVAEAISNLSQVEPLCEHERDN